MKQIQPLNLRYIINEKNPISPVKMIIQKKNCKILGVNTPGQKCDCKLGEIQLENCVINMKQLLAANMTAN